MSDELAYLCTRAEGEVPSVRLLAPGGEERFAIPEVNIAGVLVTKRHPRSGDPYVDFAVSMADIEKMEQFYDGMFVPTPTFEREMAGR